MESTKINLFVPYNTNYVDIIVIYLCIFINFIIFLLAIWWSGMVIKGDTYGGWSHFLSGALIAILPTLPPKLLGFALILDKIIVYNDLTNLRGKNIRGREITNKNNIIGLDNYIMDNLFITILLLTLLSIASIVPNPLIRVSTYLICLFVFIIMIIYISRKNK